MNYFQGRAHRRRDSRERTVIRIPEPTHDEIARLAYSYWEAAGRRQDSSLDDWLRAERELRDRADPATYW